ncbi:MerR family transcriptional regulator [Siccibacter turicensis]|uniref:MerR family transcriptional regulator n=1 Tax=Siccibacter turicensis TaxID=357233 RepID=UPI0004653569|nr:MerR family transcriptional regulator [Siccibacter turicensis]
MRIQTFAALTRLSVHTLRYYEKIGLLHPGRNASGHRDYRENEVEWISFIKRLKETGMPLEAIQRYARLRSQGNSTLAERRTLLAHHADRLAQRLAEQQAHLIQLEAKMAWYDGELLKNGA